MLDKLFRPKPVAGADPDAHLEQLGPNDWKDFIHHPLSVLILTKSNCIWCHFWQQELMSFFAKGGAEWSCCVRFGALTLDQPGLHRFKREHSWIKETVDTVPFNVIFANGNKKIHFPGPNLRYLANSLKRLRNEVPLEST